MNITEQLNNRAELWGPTRIKNKLNEWTNGPVAKIKNTVYCNIYNQRGQIITNDAGTEYSNQCYKFKVRYKSIENPKKNMFFKFKGLKYEFDYWEPDFNNREFMYIFCKLILE